jgi:hypothetical protein
MTGVPEPVQAHIPADLDTPDRVLYGLTVRQVAILAAAATVLWLAFQILPHAVVGVAAVPVAALAAAVALGRRDGISMDRWLAAAITAAWAPRRLVATSGEIPAAPSWAPSTDDVAALTPLRLPARAISASGVVSLDDAHVALTAVTTVNVELRTTGEQHALIDTTGRWLNTLSGPVQIVVSTRRVDMHAHADDIEDHLDTLAHPALADAAGGYAAFLRLLGEDRDPLDRHVLIAHRSAAGDPATARRLAEHTARALTGLGAGTRVLDGGQVTDALVGACDPWRHVAPGRTVPEQVVTGAHREQVS